MLCVSGGYNPDIHLFTQSKGLVKWDKNILSFKPDTPFQKTITLGSTSGNYNFKKLCDEINEKLSILKTLIVKVYLQTNFKYFIKVKSKLKKK